MRILSDFRDYYDGLQEGTGRVWERKRKYFYDKEVPSSLDALKESIPLAVIRKFYGGLGYNRESDFSGILFYCGKAHLIWRHKDFDANLAEAKKRIEDFRVPIELHTQFESPIILYSSKIGLRYVGKYRKETWTRIPVLHVNPCLQNLGFQKLMDHYTCYQNIRVFMENDMCPVEKKVTTVGSDEVIAQQKGFDKWSFRKMKNV